MKRQPAVFILFLMLLYLASGCTSSKQEDDPYNFNFTDRPDFRWQVTFPQAFTWDRSLNRSGKHPLVFQRDKKSLMKGLDWNTSTLRQRIVLSRTATDSIRLTVWCRSGSMKDAMLDIDLYDEQMNRIDGYGLSLNSRDGGWYPHIMTLPPEPVRVMDISISVKALADSKMVSKYKYTRFKQYLGLDKMELRIGEEDIASLGIGAREEVTRDIRFDHRRMIPLPDNGSALSLPLNDKKIIALGETSPGNRTSAKVVAGVIRDRIQNGHCRLVMLQVGYDWGLLLNHYVSGASVSPECKAVIEKWGRIALPTDLYDLLDWLREYNQGRERKVMLVGLDWQKAIGYRPELEVLMATEATPVERRTLVAVANRIANDEYKPLAEELNTHMPVLNRLLGEDPARLFRYVIACRSRYDYSKDTGSLKIVNPVDYRLLDREIWSYDAVREYIGELLNRDETACIYADGNQLARVSLIPVTSTIGNMLNHSFKEAYYPLALVAGKGECTVRNGPGNEPRNIELSVPSEKSIEQSAGKLSSQPFYYPFDKSNNTFSSLRMVDEIGYSDQTGEVRQDEYLFVPKTQFDAMIYLPEVHPRFENPAHLQKAIHQAGMLFHNRQLELLKELRHK